MRFGRLAVFGGIEDFREHLGGKLALTLPTGVGRKVEVNELPYEIVDQSLKELKHHAHTIVS